MQYIRVFITGLALTWAGLRPTVAQTISGFDHPESVCRQGNTYYVSNLGKELKPSDKDGDGYISKLNLSGTIIDLKFLPKTGKLNAPKGIVTIGNTLYVADVDRVLGYDLTTRDEVFSVTIPDVAFLNDPVVVNPQTLWVSVTDKNQLIKIDLAKKSFSVLPITGLNGPNGLTISNNGKTVYSVGFGTDNKPNGEVVSIDVATLKTKRLGTYAGMLDGVCVRGNKLYFSDWKSYENTGELQVLDLNTGKTARDTSIDLIGGFADFYISPNGKQLVVPSLTNNKVIFNQFK